MTEPPDTGCKQVVKKKMCGATSFAWHYRPAGAPRLVCSDHSTQASGYIVPIQRAL